VKARIPPKPEFTKQSRKFSILCDWYCRGILNIGTLGFIERIVEPERVIISGCRG